MAFGIHEFMVISSKGDIVHYSRSKEEAQEMANKLNKIIGYSCYTTDDRWI